MNTLNNLVITLEDQEGNTVFHNLNKEESHSFFTLGSLEYEHKVGMIVVNVLVEGQVDRDVTIPEPADGHAQIWL